MVKDMTNGSPSRHILGFAVPMLFGMLFQQFYNLVDTITETAMAIKDGATEVDIVMPVGKFFSENVQCRYLS